MFWYVLHDVPAVACRAHHNLRKFCATSQFKRKYFQFKFYGILFRSHRRSWCKSWLFNKGSATNWKLFFFVSLCNFHFQNGMTLSKEGGFFLVWNLWTFNQNPSDYCTQLQRMLKITHQRIVEYWKLIIPRRWTVIDMLNPFFPLSFGLWIKYFAQFDAKKNVTRFFSVAPFWLSIICTQQKFPEVIPTTMEHEKQ
jgi:hypothetical protein